MPAAPLPRAVRVFVSSTFRDMQADRDELVKRVFPEVRRRCEARGITFAEVDLRWGITDEEAAEGKVLPICLDEIRRCRPYFIGLLGERYGWVPDDIDATLLAQEPWLQAQADVSVTELEILHGVLNDPAMAGCSWFYLRDPQWVDRQPSPAGLIESALPAEVATLGQAEAERRAEGRRRRLAELKARIRGSGLPVREGYEDPAALGRLVLADLMQAIDDRYPPDEIPDPVALAATEHRHFAISRAHGSVERAPVIATIDRHVAGSGAPLLLVGPEGSGKTTVLADWCSRFVAAHPARVLMEHYTVATGDGAEWEALARRIASRVVWSADEQARVAAIAGDASFDVRNVLPRLPDALLEFLAASVASMTGDPIVIVVDGVERFQHGDGRPALEWLQALESPRIRLVLSARPGPAADALVARGCVLYPVGSLADDERRAFIREVLAHHAKSLAPARLERIASAGQTADPLFIATLLDELRVHGEHESLDLEIGEALSCSDATALLERVLARCERDFERERPGLVRDAMSAIWAARRGLSEPELLEALSRDEAPLVQGRWSPLRLALDRVLVERRGRLGFLHDAFRRAVERRYLANVDLQRGARRRLAAAFRRRGWTPRTVDEVPSLLAASEDWDALGDVLSDPRYLVEAWREAESAPAGEQALLAMLLPPTPASEVTHEDVLRYWALVEERSVLRLVDAWRGVFADPQHHRDVLLPLSRLMAMTGHAPEAAQLRQWVVQWASDARIRARALVDQANALGSKGQLDGMLPLLSEAEGLFRELGEPDGVLACVGNRALVQQHRGELDAALTAHREVERLSRGRGNRHGVSTALQNQAWIMSRLGRGRDAVALYGKAVLAATESGDQRLVAMTNGNLGAARFAEGEIVGAADAFTIQLTVARILGDAEQEVDALGRLAGACEAAGRIEEAAKHLVDRAARGERMGRADIMYGSHVARMALFEKARRWPEAIAAAEAARALATRFGQAAEVRNMESAIARLRTM